jgi:hypothetical protein
LIDTMNSGVDSLVNLRNVIANADVIRARAFSSAGADALVIEGGSYNAAGLLRFYAEGASTLRFRGNVSLNAANADFAGQRVTVDQGGNVNFSNSNTLVRVFADDHDYNIPTRGNINHPEISRETFSSRPPF